MSQSNSNPIDGQAFRLVTLPLHHLFPSTTVQHHTDSSPTSSTDHTETVPNDEEIDRRQRALIACTACRARKIKCSGDRPVCNTCAKNSQTCIYTPHAKRKRKARMQVIEGDRSKRLHPLDPSVSANSYQASQSIKTTTTLNPVTLSLSGDHPNVPPLGVPGPSTYIQTNQEQLNSLIQPDIITPTSEASLPQSDVTRKRIDDAAFIDPSADLEFINNLVSWHGTDLMGEDIQDGSQANRDWNLNELLGWDPAISLTRRESNDIGVAPSSIEGRLPAVQSSHVKSPRSRFRVPYFRFFGPTAIAPGYKQVQYDVSAPPSPRLPANSLSALSALDNTQELPIWDQDKQYPHTQALQHLIPIFNLHYTYFFPFLRLSASDIPVLIANKPPYLLNIICAMAARFSPLYGSRPLSAEAIDRSTSTHNSATHMWSSKAKEQISKNISFSTVEMVETLILISWYEFGQDRDAGLWMYSGMGLRMGQDLGLDTLSKQTAGDQLPQAPDELYARQLHCSLVMMDAIMTIGTGRSGMYLTQAPALPTLPPVLASDGETPADPFLYLVRILVLSDSVARTLRDHIRSPQSQLLEIAQSELNEFHTTLPTELRFETSAFQKYASMGHGSTFVLLHFWFHTLIILVYQPDLLRTGEVHLNSTLPDVAGQQIAASSAKTILDIASFAELIDVKANTQPWINYPLYIAGCMFLSQCVSPTNAAHSAGQVHLAKIARANFQRIIGLLDTLQSYWAGVRYIRGALLQKAEGATQITLLDNPNGVASPQVPPALAAMWSGQSDTSHLVGLSFTGTMNSPTDNFFSLLYPNTSAACQ